MSDIGDVFTISNSIDIEQLKKNQAAQMKLAEFRERAETLSRQTGVTPLGFFAFEKTHPTPREKTKYGFLGGAAVGALFGMVANLFVADARREAPRVSSGTGLAVVGIGAGIGALIGLNSKEQESTRLTRAIQRYDAYLSHVETVAYNKLPNQQIVAESVPQLPRSNHAETLTQERQKPAQPDQVAI